MKKFIVWTLAAIFAMTVSVAFAADEKKPAEKKMDKPAAAAPAEMKAEPAKAEEKAPAAKKKAPAKKKKVKKAAPKKEEAPAAPAAPAEKK